MGGGLDTTVKHEHLLVGLWGKEPASASVTGQPVQVGADILVIISEITITNSYLVKIKSRKK